MTQATATGAEEMTASAEEISGMADKLKTKVDYFEVS
jgi:methyl-accepting chemotaxis protein